MDRREFLLATIAAAAARSALGAETVPNLVFEGKKQGNPIRAVHGVNGGPLAAGGLVDLSVRWKEAAFPVARLHDCHWPHADVVDVSAVFPNAAADPSRPESYDFERTDECVKAIHACGSAIVYRLGEGIEHQKAKRRARPPHDFEKWAEVCAGIVRHYTAGWANGLELPIRYWEIWNEPDNRPNCWTGTDDDYLRLYSITSQRLRKEFPAIKIGGPALGNSGELKGDRFEPTAFAKAFLAACRKDNLPLDFFSWHCYTADPTELVRRAAGVRALLDESGFKATESHLNEWNYLPDGSWDGLATKDAKVRERWFERVNGAEGAAFVAAALIALEDAQVDMANYFTAEAPGMGLFSQHGVPSRAFGAFVAFRELVGLKQFHVRAPAGVFALGGVGDKQVRILLARTSAPAGPVKFAIVPEMWSGASDYEVLRIDEGSDLKKVAGGRTERFTLDVDLPANSVCLVRLRPSEKV